MIKTVYKGKRNKYVIELSNDAKKPSSFYCDEERFDNSNVYITFYEIDLKALKIKAKHYDTPLHDDYVKSKGLKRISYDEFCLAVREETTKLENATASLRKKLSKYTDPKTNPELRHALYEYRSNIKPMLTEGLIRGLKIAQQIYQKDSELSTFTEYLLELDDSIELKDIYVPSVRPDDDVFEDFMFNLAFGEEYVKSVYKSGKYDFDDDVCGESDLTDEEDDVTTV